MAYILTPETIAYDKAHADDTLQPNQIATGICGLLVAFGAVIARAFARRASRASFGWDDWLMVASLIPLSAYAILIFYNVSIGDGRHIIYITNMAGFIQAFVAQMVAYSTAIALIKMSILVLYHRIFTSRTLFWLSWAIGVVVIAYNMAVVFVTALQCIPLSVMWEKSHSGARCISNTLPFAVIAIVNVITDFLILALPVRSVWHLQMKTSRKLQILFMFFLGGIVCIFGVIRVYSVATIVEVDASYNEVYPEMWSFIEISMGVLAACLPTYGVLIKKAKTMYRGSNAPGKSLVPLNSKSQHQIRGRGLREPLQGEKRKSTWPQTLGAWFGGGNQNYEQNLKFSKSRPSFYEQDKDTYNDKLIWRPDEIHIRSEMIQTHQSMI